ncbi:hypothetical protein L9F63_024255, partial [Diploptera punctata]
SFEKLSWSPDCSMLAVGHSNGVVCHSMIFSVVTYSTSILKNFKKINNSRIKINL